MWVQAVKSGVEMLAYSPDGRALYVADAGRRVTAWDTTSRTGRELFTLDPVLPWGMFCAAGGRFLVFPNYTPLVWDLREKRQYAHIDIQRNPSAPGTYAMRPVPTDDSLLYINRGPNLSMRVWDTTTSAFGLDPA